MKMYFQRQEGHLIDLEYLGGKGGGMNIECYIFKVLKGLVTQFFAEIQCLQQGPIFM